MVGASCCPTALTARIKSGECPSGAHTPYSKTLLPCRLMGRVIATDVPKYVPL